MYPLLRSVIVLLIACAVGQVRAAVVDSVEARSRARLFLQQLSVQAPKRMAASALTLVHTGYRPSVAKRQAAADAVPAYYVFNVGQEQGFVVVAAREGVRSVLGYATQGCFDAAALPTPCSALLDAYAEEMTTLADAEVTAIALPSYYPTQAIAPLLATHWDQGDPYNRECPEDVRAGNGKRCLTGCTATALAQIMRYHQYPERPTGKITYYDAAQYTYRTMDFDSRSPFDWAHMTNDYTAASSEVECAAVSNLMACVGHAAKMDYSSTVSLSVTKSAAHGLVTYFGYDERMRHYERLYTDDSTWVHLLHQELKAGRPVLYNGRNPQMGHAFVCDGYDGEGRFHFNWGWGGRSDGYFVLSALDPDQQGAGGSATGYTFNQTMECGIAPAGTASTLQEQLLALKNVCVVDDAYHYIYSDTVTLPAVQPFSLECGYLHIAHVLFDGTMCVGYEDAGGQVVPVAESAALYVGYGTGERTLSLRVVPGALAPGVYHLAFYHKMTGETRWRRMAVPRGGLQGLECTVTDEAVRLVRQQPALTLAVPRDYTFGAVYANTRKTVRLPVANTGTVTMEGYVGLLLRDSRLAEDHLTCALCYCEPGATDTLTLELDLTGVPVGDYTLQVVYGENGNIATVPTVAMIQRYGQALPLTVGSLPQMVLEQVSGGYVLNRQQGQIQVTLSYMSKTGWAGRLMAQVRRVTGPLVTDREPTTLLLTSDTLTLSRPLLCKVPLYAADVPLDAGDGYDLVFYLDDGYPTVLCTAPLAIVDEASAAQACRHLQPRMVYKGASTWQITGDEPLCHVMVVSRDGRLWHTLAPGTNRCELQLPEELVLVHITTPTQRVTYKIQQK